MTSQWLDKTIKVCQESAAGGGFTFYVVCTLHISNLFAVNLNLGSTDIEVREDVTLVNFNGLISSVGGSLGLFLGFSFYQFLLSVMYFLMSHTG